MTLLHRVCIAVFVLTALCESTFAAEAARTQVLLVGTYHLANPGKDLNNVKAVDILAADRQREIGNVVAGPARFAPTQVAVEWPALQAMQPGDRVVVFYGQGHIYLLQQCLREQVGVQLVDPLSYLVETK
jgi:hypothetical protein